jgi:hypothetical protein
MVHVRRCVCVFEGTGKTYRATRLKKPKQALKQRAMLVNALQQHAHTLPFFLTFFPQDPQQ